jgi:diadenosine tetraphosphate (Ap4A) HIT family hydrolase
VRAGDQIAPGQTIGACGNSGNSSEPHLHFHLCALRCLACGRARPREPSARGQ